MDERRNLGLQWRLVAATLANGVISSGLAVLGFWVAEEYGLGRDDALLVGVTAGLAGALVASVWSFWLARRIKYRLWNAGDLALRIRRGDLSARLPVGDDDEIGELEQQLNQMAAYLEQAVGDLSRMAEQNRLLAEEAGRGAALEERARLARDLHDTVNQQLFVLSLRAAAVRKRVSRELSCDGAVPTAPLSWLASLPDELAALEEMARAAHSQTRELILQLRPTTLEQQGLGPALAEYVKTAAAREGWDVETEIDPALRLRGPEGEALFRVAQEALNNAAKHARASRIRVCLRRADGEVRLVVADDGVGFDRSSGIRPTAVGLVGMRERMAALGGRIQVRTAPGKGTEITAILPAPHPAQPSEQRSKPGRQSAGRGHHEAGHPGGGAG